MTVKGAGESHEAVKPTGSGFGVDAQAGPEGHPSSSGSPCPPDLSRMTLSWGGDSRAGSRQSWVGTLMLAPGNVVMMVKFASKFHSLMSRSCKAAYKYKRIGISPSPGRLGYLESCFIPNTKQEILVISYTTS